MQTDLVFRHDLIDRVENALRSPSVSTHHIDPAKASEDEILDLEASRIAERYMLPMKLIGVDPHFKPGGRDIVREIVVGREWYDWSTLAETLLLPADLALFGFTIMYRIAAESAKFLHHLWKLGLCKGKRK
jgi:hypothetical protein